MNEAGCVFVTTRFTGWFVMTGDTIIVSVMLLVTAPAVLLAINEYVPWLEGY